MKKAMTTYLLHGGNTSTDSQNNDEFFQQFTELVDKDEVKILLCYWAVPKNQWEELFLRDSKKILKNTKKKTKLHVVTDPTDLSSKIADFDVLYVAGGKPKLIEPYYSGFKNLKKQLAGKIYIGSSMGVFMVSESYVVSRNNQFSNIVHKGIGLLPIQTLCHWDVENKKQQKLDLLKKNSNLPILTLDETKFVTIFQS